MVWIYNYWSGDDADEDVSKHLDAMVEERGRSQAAEKLRRNWLEVHCKMQHWVKYKLT